MEYLFLGELRTSLTMAPSLRASLLTSPLDPFSESIRTHLNNGDALPHILRSDILIAPNAAIAVLPLLKIAVLLGI